MKNQDTVSSEVLEVVEMEVQKYAVISTFLKKSEMYYNRIGSYLIDEEKNYVKNPSGDLHTLRKPFAESKGGGFFSKYSLQDRVELLSDVKAINEDIQFILDSGFRNETSERGKISWFSNAEEV